MAFLLQKFGPDHSVADYTCPVPMELTMRRRPRDLVDPAAMNPEQLTSAPT